MIDFTKGHTGVIGRTRSGKTYATKYYLEREKAGVLFWNTQHEDMPKKFIMADGSDDIDTMIMLLDKGEKINFLPSFDILHHAPLQLAALVDALYDGRKHNIIFAVDEAHLYKKHGLSALMRLATTGLRWGITLVPITQRLAKMHNDLMTQLIQVTIFETNNEQQYFKAYGYPYEEIEQRLIKGGKYSYCVYDGKHVEGAFKLK